MAYATYSASCSCDDADLACHGEGGESALRVLADIDLWAVGAVAEVAWHVLVLLGVLVHD